MADFLCVKHWFETISRVEKTYVVNFPGLLLKFNGDRNFIIEKV